MISTQLLITDPSDSNMHLSFHICNRALEKRDTGKGKWKNEKTITHN